MKLHARIAKHRAVQLLSDAEYKLEVAREHLTRAETTVAVRDAHDLMLLAQRMVLEATEQVFRVLAIGVE